MLLSNPSKSPILCKRRAVRASGITCSVPLRHNAIEIATGRREALAMLIGTGALLLQPQRSLAAVPLPGPPPGDGFRRHVDKLDGYSFNYPDTWINVTTSGNDVFFRNPRNLDENLFVELSSPSSSKFNSVADLGSPADAAARYLKQYLNEFNSTRLGVRREAQVLSAKARTADDGRVYYDLVIGLQSYAARQQLAITQEERFQELEWDRRLVTTLGVANRRLYELRVQAGANGADSPSIRTILDSFRVREVDV